MAGPESALSLNSGDRTALLLNCTFGGWGSATGEAWFDDLEVVELIDPVLVMTVDEKNRVLRKESQTNP